MPKGQECPLHQAHHRHGGRAVGRELASADRLQKTIEDSGGFLALAAIHRSMVPPRRLGSMVAAPLMDQPHESGESK